MTFASTLYIVDIVTYVNNALLILILGLSILAVIRYSTEGLDKLNRKTLISAILLFVIFLIIPNGRVVCEAGGFKYIVFDCLKD